MNSAADDNHMDYNINPFSYSTPNSVAYTVMLTQVKMTTDLGQKLELNR